MILSGDAVVDYSPAQWAILHRALGRPPIAARFENNRFDVGVIDEPDRRVVTLLNWDDAPTTRRIPVTAHFAGASVRVTDFWSGEVVHTATSADFDLHLPAATGRVLVLEENPVAVVP